MMSRAGHFDTVAFDVRDNAAMLFFAATSDNGDIRNYLLLMRDAESMSDSVYLEVDELQCSGAEVLDSATLTGNLLTLNLGKEAVAIFKEQEFVVTFDDTPENRSAFEEGSFKVLGDKLTGGHS